MLCPRCHRLYPASSTRCVFDGEALSQESELALSRAADTRQSGAVIGGRYQIRGTLGQGAMARVYLAEDLQTKAAVAVKVLLGGDAKDSIAVERFAQEAETAGRLAHPNIVRIVQAGQQGNGLVFCAMEYLFGESLGDLIRRTGPIGADLGLPILAQAAAGLGAAHAAKIVHRDVKPDNLFLVGEPGEPYGVKVVDFGLAKVREGSLTAAGTIVGTMEYMAPEQVIADRVDGRTDIYALGVTMFKIFTGKLPFEREDTARLLAKQLITPYPPLTQFRDDLSPGVQAIFARCTRKNPNNRYPSTAALISDIDAVLAGATKPPFATTPLPESDVYLPKSPRSRKVASLFYSTLDLDMPVFG